MISILFSESNSFQSISEELKKKIAEIEFEYENGEYTIKERCSELRRQVQLSKEETILKIDDLSDKMLSEIDKYEEDKLQKYSLMKSLDAKNKKQQDTSLEQIQRMKEEFEQNVARIKKNLNARSLNIFDLKKLQANLDVEQEKAKNLIFDRNILEYTASSLNLENIIGQLNYSQRPPSVDKYKLKIDLSEYFDCENISNLGFLANGKLVATSVDTFTDCYEFYAFDKDFDLIHVDNIETPNFSIHDSNVCYDYLDENTRFVKMLGENFSVIMKHEISHQFRLIGFDKRYFYFYLPSKNPSFDKFYIFNMFFQPMIMLNMTLNDNLRDVYYRNSFYRVYGVQNSNNIMLYDKNIIISIDMSDGEIFFAKEGFYDIKQVCVDTNSQILKIIDSINVYYHNFSSGELLKEEKLEKFEHSISFFDSNGNVCYFDEETCELCI